MKRRSLKKLKNNQIKNENEKLNKKLKMKMKS